MFWANSRLRTVYFSTHDIDGYWAFQGVTKLASHSLVRRRISRAMGFYGIENDYRPIRGQRHIPRLFRADGVGTDIYVAGFDAARGWELKLIEEFAANFFVAFHDDLLRVRIRQHEISAANIGGIITALGDQQPARFGDLRNFFDALVSDEAKEFSKSFANLGNCTVRLLLREGARKKIAMFRATGMKIFERGHFRTPLEFAGVFFCKDLAGNDFLRQLEPPSHNAWQPERYEVDSRQAKETVGEVYSWLKDCVQDLYPAQDRTYLDIPDLAQYLPDEDEIEAFDVATGSSEGDPRPRADMVLEGKTRREANEGKSSVAELAGGEEGDEQEGGAGEEEGDEGGGSGNDAEGGDRGAGKGSVGTGTIETKASYRIFRQPGSASLYRMRVQLEEAGVYSFVILAVGDDGRSEATLPLGPVWMEATGGATPLSFRQGNRFGSVPASESSVVDLEFELKSAVPFSLNARVYKDG